MSDIDTNIRIVFTKSQFTSYLTTNVVMTFQLHIFPGFFSPETNRVKADNN